MESSVVCLEETRYKSKVTEERAIQYPLPSKNSKLFQLFFLAHDQNQSIEVVEVEEVDFEEVSQRLKQGESVFITYKPTETHKQRLKTKEEEKKEPWYITHF